MELTLARLPLLSFRKESHLGWCGLITAHNISPFLSGQGSDRPADTRVSRDPADKRETLSSSWQLLVTSRSSQCGKG